MKYSLLIALLLLGCQTQEVPAVAPGHVPYKMIMCHTDPLFSPQEYVKVQSAASKWARVTEYHTQISTPQDLHFNNVGTLSPCTIVKVDSRNRMVRKVEAQYRAFYPERNDIIHMFTVGQRIYVIADRVKLEEFEWEMTHEMGHALGLPDIDDELGHVMSRVGPFLGADFTNRDKRLCRLQGVCP